MRDLCLSQRVKVVQTFLLPNIWYSAHVLPITSSHSHQLTTAMLWYIWQVEIFPVSISTFYRWVTEGCIDLHTHTHTHTQAQTHTAHAHTQLDRRIRGFSNRGWLRPEKKNLEN